MGREPNVVVQFSQRWSVFNKGERAGVAPQIAEQLVKSGVARLLPQPKADEPSAAPKGR